MVTMDRIFLISIAILLWSCTSNQVRKSSSESTVTPREVDLMEAFEISKSDSQQLVSNWHEFINNLGAQKGKSLDIVECWSVEAFQNGNYSPPRFISLDTCIIRWLLPLQKTEVWTLFMTNDYNVGIQKLQSKQTGRYYISFPRSKSIENKYHEKKHTFFFEKLNGEFGFRGYIYN